MLAIFKNLYFQYTSLFIFLIAGILLVSYPGWSGQFIFDDYPNIVSNTSLNAQQFSFNTLLTATFSGTASALGRPISMLSFAINTSLHGLDPFYFKVTNTIIHTLNALLAFLLSLKLLRLTIFKQSLKLSNQSSLHLAFIVGFIWAITPANINNSLYIVQRMNELSFLFTFSACLLYLHIRTRRLLPRVKQLFSFLLLSLLLALAILSKENGLLLIPLLMMFELFLLKKEHKTYNILFFYCTIVLLFFIPFITLCYYFFTHYQSLLNYDFRDFNLYERALTEPRVLVHYIKQLIFPNIYQLSYDFDYIAKSSSLLQPISTLVSVLLLILSLVISLFYHKKLPWLLFGVLWFFIGHSIESTILPLVLTYEHRNYLPSFGIIFIVIVTGHYLYTSKKMDRIKLVFPFLLMAYISFLLVYSYLSSAITGNTNRMLKINAENHPNSARSQYSWGYVLFNWSMKQPNVLEFKQLAEHQFNLVIQLNPTRIAAMTNFILLKQRHNENINREINQLYQILPRLKTDSQHVHDTRKFIQLNNQLKNPLPTEIIYKYFNLLLANKKITGKYKAYLHRDYADYILIQEGSTDQVFYHLQKSVKLEPSISNKLYLVQVLIIGNKLKQAELLLEQIEQKNTKSLFLKNIKNLKNILNIRLNSKVKNQ